MKERLNNTDTTMLPTTLNQLNNSYSWQATVTPIYKTWRQQ